MDTLNLDQWEAVTRWSYRLSQENNYSSLDRTNVTRMTDYIRETIDNEILNNLKFEVRKEQKSLYDKLKLTEKDCQL